MFNSSRISFQILFLCVAVGLSWPLVAMEHRATDSTMQDVDLLSLNCNLSLRKKLAFLRSGVLDDMTRSDLDSRSLGDLVNDQELITIARSLEEQKVTRALKFEGEEAALAVLEQHFQGNLTINQIEDLNRALQLALDQGYSDVAQAILDGFSDYIESISNNL